MELYFKKHANYIESGSDLIISIDLFCFSNAPKLKKLLKLHYCASKSILTSNIIPIYFDLNFNNLYDIYINYIKSYIYNNFNYEIVNDLIILHNTNIKEFNLIINNLDYLDINNKNFTLKLYHNENDNINITISVNEKNKFTVKHRNFKKIITLKKYNKLTNIFNISLFLNNRRKSSACNQFYFKEESAFNLYFRYINYILGN